MVDTISPSKKKIIKKCSSLLFTFILPPNLNINNDNSNLDVNNYSNNSNLDVNDYLETYEQNRKSIYNSEFIINENDIDDFFEGS